MKFKNVAILSILSVTLFAGCSDKEKIDSKVVAKHETTVVQTPVKKHEIPKFNLKTSTGKLIEVTADVKNGWKFKGYENKVILLDFFATWCPPCKAEIPHLNTIRKDLKKDLEIIGIDIGQRDGSITDNLELAQFIEDFKIKYPVTSGVANSSLFRAVSSLNPGGSIPFMILFNKKGEFIQYYIGMKPEEMLRQDINTAIKMK